MPCPLRYVSVLCSSVLIVIFMLFSVNEKVSRYHSSRSWCGLLRDFFTGWYWIVLWKIFYRDEDPAVELENELNEKMKSNEDEMATCPRKEMNRLETQPNTRVNQTLRKRKIKTLFQCEK